MIESITVFKPTSSLEDIIGTYKYADKMRSNVGVLLSLVAAVTCAASSLAPAGGVQLGASLLAGMGARAVDSELTVSGLSGGAFFAVQVAPATTFSPCSAST
jgi:hypothetical protein